MVKKKNKNVELKEIKNLAVFTVFKYPDNGIGIVIDRKLTFFGKHSCTKVKRFKMNDITFKIMQSTKKYYDYHNGLYVEPLIKVKDMSFGLIIKSYNEINHSGD